MIKNLIVRLDGTRADARSVTTDPTAEYFDSRAVSEKLEAKLQNMRVEMNRGVLGQEQRMQSITIEYIYPSHPHSRSTTNYLLDTISFCTRR